jgi:hypothetical protein
MPRHAQPVYGLSDIEQLVSTGGAARLRTVRMACVVTSSNSQRFIKAMTMLTEHAPLLTQVDLCACGSLSENIRVALGIMCLRDRTLPLYFELHDTRQLRFLARHLKDFFSARDVGLYALCTDVSVVNFVRRRRTEAKMLAFMQLHPTMPQELMMEIYNLID